MSLSTRLSALAASVALVAAVTAPVAVADTAASASSGAAAPAAPGPTVNLVTNPGFELPAPNLSDWGSIAGWSCTGGPAEAAVTTTAPHGGTSALTVTPANADSTGECAQTVAVQPNTSYTASAWVRGNFVYLGATGTGRDVAPAWTETTGGSWQELTTRFTTGPNARSIGLYVHGWYQEGPYSVDDVHVDGPAPAPAVPAGSVPTTDKVVFFTVDDGWQRTPEAEKFIADHHLPITAFPLPMPAGTDPGFFQRVTAVPGSSIQDHSVSHSDLSKLTLEQQQVEICDARDALTRLFGTAPVVFRPPYFAWNADTLQAAANCGIRTVLTADADFSWGASNIWHPGTLQPGDVVLMHWANTLATDLPRALAAADAAGLKPAGLVDYLR
ncbi:polysaccharide deacetylase family protein [Kitasatospora aureofaciens]|uniref:polysaccharide deacetylase family protein n=1 Tax=Kitasatospora aureofaciens TaxID=1894 RepID=UPI001C440845|nr:polysaccharide deacetylase family protein [Kitasatospora aureofaciens]MBV6703390.1 polysaccharide deacetylase family protein [Kitasatospora aureofaciens]